MLSQPLPDLTSSLRLQSQSQTVRAQLEIAADEVATGLTADLRSATRGDLAPIFSIDRAIQRIDVALQDLSLAAGRAQVAQTALGMVSDTSNTLGLDLAGAAARGDGIIRDRHLNEAPELLRGMMSALNTEFGDRSLFAGAAEDQTALAPADTLIADVSALLGAAASPAAALAAVDAYFDTPGGGFEATIYTGSTVDAAGVELDEGSRITYLPRADDPAIREALKGAVLLAAADSVGFAGDDDAFNSFVGDAALRLRDAGDAVIDLRATLGVGEEQIATAQDALAAEQSTLRMTRNDLIGVDQFDAAARMSALETQLESLYVVTGRLASLTLTNYIR